ncbi:electron transfer flavoprotein subunit alpha/FixB family protein [Vulcanisaeta souniana]|uniref:Electron transfer flavoprotein subunit alpha n=1 Tax=Vulcanisaeta souniana JCM 11219 TaxID=1293586 RepID=A0A830E2U0_9CREN|nr:electron transfer flavoprotein subunit alpha/FixB family protein [Vulcanisaeta souniana]BDR93370.1 electron transfer flavoprotein subunit alpha [Vulcanisaeta souniana JCM 11219]GGI76637.1 electron transfer flavoprotein subunit alpha [Vulcanisaeta souniana JCM 11219]
MSTAQTQQKICSEWNPVNKNEHKGIWVYVELINGVIKDGSLQLIGKARELAGKISTDVTAIMLGHNIGDVVKEPIYYGADKVIYIDHPALEKYVPHIYSNVIVQLATKYKPEIILFAATKRGRELAPYVANSLKTGITADCTELDVDPKTRDLDQVRPTYGGSILAHIRTPSRRPQLASVRPNVFPTPPRDPNRNGEIIVETIDTPPGINGHGLINVRPVVKGEELPPVEKSDVVVVAGRGVGSTDGVKLLTELAKLLGGTIGGTKKAVDAGWLDLDRQVGQTGKTIRPALYIGVGVSGAIQHVFGMKESKVIVAINSDPNAPIFEYADYGVVGDYREIVKELIELLKNSRSK